MDQQNDKMTPKQRRLLGFKERQAKQCIMLNEMSNCLLSHGGLQMGLALAMPVIGVPIITSVLMLGSMTALVGGVYKLSCNWERKKFDLPAEASQTKFMLLPNMQKNFIRRQIARLRAPKP